MFRNRAVQTHHSNTLHENMQEMILYIVLPYLAFFNSDRRVIDIHGGGGDGGREVGGSPLNLCIWGT